MNWKKIKNGGGFHMAQSTLPLVSILIPAYNRPEYLRIALINALSQTYKNIEIVVCDDSTNDDVKNVVQSFRQNHPQVKYFKNERTLFLDNWQRCLEKASGEYINFLMDDDVFHPEKIEKMIGYLLTDPDVSLVTSFRQLIDEHGNLLPPIPATTKLFNKVKKIDGKELGNLMLLNCTNYIGEGTTVLFRRNNLKEKFGTFLGREYCCINDVATWMSLLTTGKAVYIPEALSYFRIHQNQNSRNETIISTSIEEWLHIILDSTKVGFLGNKTLFAKALFQRKNQLENTHFSRNQELEQRRQAVITRINGLLTTL